MFGGEQSAHTTEKGVRVGVGCVLTIQLKMLTCDPSYALSIDKGTNTKTPKSATHTSLFSHENEMVVKPSSTSITAFRPRFPPNPGIDADRTMCLADNVRIAPPVRGVE